MGRTHHQATPSQPPPGGEGGDPHNGIRATDLSGLGSGSGSGSDGSGAGSGSSGDPLRPLVEDTARGLRDMEHEVNGLAIDVKGLSSQLDFVIGQLAKLAELRSEGKVKEV